MSKESGSSCHPDIPGSNLSPGSPEGKTAPAVITPTKKPSGATSAAGEDDVEASKKVCADDDAAEKKDDYPQKSKKQARDFTVNPLTQPELSDKFRNDRDYRLDCMRDTFWPALELVWPEILYVSPNERDDFDGRAIECQNEENLWKMVFELLEFLDNCGVYEVEGLESFGDADEGMPEEDKGWVQQAIPWDSDSRFQNFQTVCQMFRFVILEDFESIVDHFEEENPKITGSELMEQMRKCLDESKEWHLEYYKCPWNSYFLDENDQRCDDSLAKWVVFPEGFTQEDYEKAWEAEQDAKVPAKADTKEQLQNNTEQAGGKQNFDAGGAPDPKRQKVE